MHEILNTHTLNIMHAYRYTYVKVYNYSYRNTYVEFTVYRMCMHINIHMLSW